MTQSTKSVLSIAEFAQQAGICRATVYKEIRAGRIKVTKCGRRTLLPATEISAWLDRLQNEAK